MAMFKAQLYLISNKNLIIFTFSLIFFELIFLILIYQSNQVFYSNSISATAKNFNYDKGFNKELSRLVEEIRVKDINYYKGFKEELCKLPNLKIWETRIRELLKPEPIYDKCKNHTPISYIISRRLYIDEEINVAFYSGNISYCQLAPVIRSTINNDNYILGEFKNFTDGLLIIFDYIQVRCFNKNNTLLYEYVHYVFQPVLKKDSATSKNLNKKLNVLIMIFDSVSDSSFKRSLPKTLKFLKSYKNFFHFTKHHTVGPNTLPNVVPMLSGKRSEELLGNATIPPPFDDFPFIWKNFSKSNYVTYLNEDWRNSMFNNDKFGFLESPTDYYLRPYWLALYNSKSSKPNILNSNSDPCYYEKLYHKLSFDWLREFHQIYGSLETQNTFGILKSNEMSHDYLSRLDWIDDDLTLLLKDLFTEKFLENTLLILMGDHGHRFHPIRQTFTGKLEEKLPFFSMMVPSLLLRKNSFLSEVLNENTKSKFKLNIYDRLTYFIIFYF